MKTAEWRESHNFIAMLDYLFAKQRLDERRTRLFVIACCRHGWDKMPKGECREAVEVAQRYVENKAIERRRQEAYETVREYIIQAQECYNRYSFEDSLPVSNLNYHLDMQDRINAAFRARLAVFNSNYVVTRTLDCLVPNNGIFANSEAAYYSNFLRDIFPDPTKSQPKIDPRWLTSSVVDLARSMYKSGDFSHMPVLGDALMDAGCTNEAMIANCRSGGPHVRGNWVVDMVLGKNLSRYR